MNVINKLGGVSNVYKILKKMVGTIRYPLCACKLADMRFRAMFV